MTAESMHGRFVQVFGAEPQLVVRSPGRVNLIGEHTDYNDGWALPVAVDLHTEIAARRRADRMLHMVAPRMNARDEVSIDELHSRQGPQWSRYVRGVAALLREAGCDVGGADILVDGDLPIGAGLSSSASLELGVTMAFATLADFPVDAAAQAQLGQRVENEIIGVQSGIMDQLSIALAVEGHALLMDCRSMNATAVPIPDSMRILVLDSGVARMLTGSAYNERRGECRSALHILQGRDPRLRALRDVNEDLLSRWQSDLPRQLHRRARHVVTENRRVLEAVAALQQDDLHQFGRLLTESHESLREDYQVSIRELDTLVDIARSTPGVLGARLTGAGFGGCALAVVSPDTAESAQAEIVRRYRTTTGRPGRAFACATAGRPAVRWPFR